MTVTFASEAERNATLAQLWPQAQNEWKLDELLMQARTVSSLYGFCVFFLLFFHSFLYVFLCFSCCFLFLFFSGGVANYVSSFKYLGG
jgi:hypothetical protein